MIQCTVLLFLNGELMSERKLIWLQAMAMLKRGPLKNNKLKESSRQEDFI